MTFIKGIISTLCALSLCTGVEAHALGPDDPYTKDSTGHYTVKCQVHQNAPGNPVIGFVIGNHPSDANLAEQDANLFVSLFGGGVAKRHCRTQGKYTYHGAYTVYMQPL